MQHTPNNLDTGSDGANPSIVGRSAEFDALTQELENEHYLYIYGPKGSGKTHLTQHALQELPDQTTVCSLSCITHNTQYKVLNALYGALTGGELSSGYHTAQLTNAITEALPDHDLVLVLDDIDFLLLNDGNDLLYFLSRLDQQRTPRLVMLSANHPELSTQIDERIHSSLLPHTLYLRPYTKDEATQVLNTRTDDWLHQPVSADVLAHVAAATANIQFVHHWLTVAEDIVDGEITENVVQLVRSDARQRYQQRLLDPFTMHHDLLMDAIELLAADTEPLRSGAIYGWYRDLCHQNNTEPRSTRRLSDYLKHLELLDLIRTEYQYGGEDGKTRHVWLQEF